MVPFNEELTKTLNKYIEDLEIDTVYSHWIGDVHRDHQATGRCALMAGRHVPRFLMYRSNFYDSDRQFVGNFYSDVSDSATTDIATTYPKSDNPVRLSTDSEYIGCVHDEHNFPLPLVKQTYGAGNMPPAVDGTMYIVSQLVQSAYPDRHDLIVPADVVRDGMTGAIVGCRTFAVNK